MAQPSPEIIEQTILAFKRRTGRAISEEDARQAVENVSGFFRMLQQWDEADVGKGGVEVLDSSSTDNRGAG